MERSRGGVMLTEAGREIAGRATRILAETRTIALRRLGSQAQEVLALDEAIAKLGREATPPDLL